MNSKQFALTREGLPLIALHLQPLMANPFALDDFLYDAARRINISPEGEIACARASRPYTSALTPGHTIPSGYTPSGKWRPSKYVPGKMDKRAGK